MVVRYDVYPGYLFILCQVTNQSIIHSPFIAYTHADIYSRDVYENILIVKNTTM